MTVTATTASQAFEGNGTATAFPCGFEIILATDIHVYFVNPTTGVQTLAALNSDYTVTGAGNAGGFTINTTVPVPTGTNLYAVRALPLTQLIDLTNQGAFFPTLHEAAFDRLCMQIQQIANGIALGISLPPGLVPEPSNQLPAPLASSLIGWNATADALVNVGPSGIGAGVVGTVNIANGAVTTPLIATAAITAALIASGAVTDPAVASDAGIQSTKLANTQVGAGAVTRNVQAKFSERVSVLDFGADASGAVDSTAAFNAALTASNDVFVPPGTYVLGNAVTIKSGQRLRGAGRRKAILRMPSTFNGAALGCLVFNGGEPGPEVEGLCIIQDQPDSVTPTVYPPAIYAEATPRFAIRHCRIACVYNGIDMKGDAGGAVIDDLELSSLNIGIDIDGALDVVRINNLHYWVFGGAGSGTLTANQTTAMLAAYGIKTGRCDGLQVVNALLYGSLNAFFAYTSSNGSTFGVISASDFDSSGGPVVSGGNLYVSACTVSLNRTGGTWANLSGGVVQFQGCNFVAGANVPSANGYVLLSGGAATFINCLFGTAAIDHTTIYASAGQLVVAGCVFGISVSTFANPVIWCTGAVRGAITGNSVNPCVSGNWLRVDTDTGLIAIGNIAPSWSVKLPTGTAPKTIVVGNGGGSAANADDYVGYFSSDATTIVKLPSGWTVSRLGAGNYSVTHNLGVTAVTDLVISATADTNGAAATYSIAESVGNSARIRTQVSGTSTDSGVFFRVKRYRA